MATIYTEKSESEILRTNNEFPLKSRAYLQHFHRDKTAVCRSCAPVPPAAPTSCPSEAPRRASKRSPRVASRSTTPPPRWRGRSRGARWRGKQGLAGGGDIRDAPSAREAWARRRRGQQVRAVDGGSRARRSGTCPASGRWRPERDLAGGISWACGGGRPERRKTSATS
jgi:hypothetical protein